MATCKPLACLVAAVQGLLDEGFRSELDVEEVCRAFLDLAKAWSRRLIEMMYTDAGRHGHYTAAQYLLSRLVRPLLPNGFITLCNCYSSPARRASSRYSQSIGTLLWALHSWPAPCKIVSCLRALLCQTWHC
jgi:hypothetical protein